MNVLKLAFLKILQLVFNKDTTTKGKNEESFLILIFFGFLATVYADGHVKSFVYQSNWYGQGIVYPQ